MCIRDSAKALDQNAALKAVKRKLSDLDKAKIDEQKRAVRSGVDMDILPPDLCLLYTSRWVEETAGDVLKGLDEIEEKPDYIILDPPRDGIHPKAIGKIIEYGVENMVYILSLIHILMMDVQRSKNL